jgi:hypothetical protein
MSHAITWMQEPVPLVVVAETQKLIGISLEGSVG